MARRTRRELNEPFYITTGQADSIVHLLGLDVDEYEQFHDLHTYFLVDGRVLEINANGMVELQELVESSAWEGELRPRRSNLVQSEIVGERLVRYWKEGQDLGTISF